MADGEEGLVIRVTDEGYDKIVEENPLLVIDCYADWCGPCKIIAPIIDQLALEFKSKITFGKLNTDDNPNTAMSFNIMAIPTLLFLKNGKLVDRVTGVIPKSEIEKKLLNLLK